MEVGEVEHLFDVYISPGSVTKTLHFFEAPYSRSDLVDTHDGVASAGEHIETVELGIDEALDAIGTTNVDAKAIMLLQWATLRRPFSPCNDGHQ